jgi:rod shape-determining protein MreC
MWNKSPVIRGLATLLLFFALEGVSLFFIARDSLFQKVKITGLFMQVKGSISGFTSDIRYFTGLRKVNEVLQEENILLKNQVEALSASLRERDSMQVVPATDANPEYHYIPARIISNSTNKLQNFIILDKGKKHGVEKDMGVVSPRGVVGVVSEVTENYSYVISFLNTTQSVSAKISPSGAFGPLLWEGKRTDYATLTEIPHHIKFMVGDTVYTSGYSTIFPANIPIGTARKSTLKSGTHHRIQVKLFQDFSTLHFVKIVAHYNRKELESILPENYSR